MVRDVVTGREGAEIGVQQGVFSEEILRCNPSILHLVDCWQHQVGPYNLDPSNYQQAIQDQYLKEVTQRFKEDKRVQIHKIWSQQPELVGRKMDWIYLDADHTYESVKRDISVWLPWIKDDGVIMGHDYTDNGKARKMGFGVVRAVNEFCENTDWKLVALTDEEWTSWKLVRQ